MRIRVPWWAFPIDTLTFVLIFIPGMIAAASLNGLVWALFVAILLLGALVQSRTTGWTLAPDAVRVHPGPFRKSVDVPWAEIQGLVAERAFGGTTLAFWTTQGLRPERLSRGPNLGRRRVEKIRAHIEAYWLAHRGPDWRPLPGPWNPEPAPAWDFGPDPFAPPPTPG